MTTNGASSNGASTTGERLLAVATELFRTKGYGATTTREIAETLNLQKGSLYHHIRSKEDLLERICLSSLEPLHAQVASAVDAAAPEDRLRALIASHVRCALSDREAHAVMLIELRSLGQERRAEVVAARDRYQDLVARVVREAQAAGTLRQDVDGHLLTLALLGLLNWVIFWYRPDGQLSLDELAETLVEVFLDGAVGVTADAGDLA